MVLSAAERAASEQVQAIKDYLDGPQRELSDVADIHAIMSCSMQMHSCCIRVGNQHPTWWQARNVIGAPAAKLGPCRQSPAKPGSSCRSMVTSRFHPSHAAGIDDLHSFIATNLPSACLLSSTRAYYNCAKVLE
jgi:hypothetical protein